MENNGYKLIVILVLALLFFLSGCSTVPEIRYEYVYQMTYPDLKDCDSLIVPNIKAYRSTDEALYNSPYNVVAISTNAVAFDNYITKAQSTIWCYKEQFDNVRRLKAEADRINKIKIQEMNEKQQE